MTSSLLTKLVPFFCSRLSVPFEYLVTVRHVAMLVAWQRLKEQGVPDRNQTYDLLNAAVVFSN